jgi:hypothetical protein
MNCLPLTETLEVGGNTLHSETTLFAIAMNCDSRGQDNPLQKYGRKPLDNGLFTANRTSVYEGSFQAT